MINQENNEYNEDDPEEADEAMEEDVENAARDISNQDNDHNNKRERSQDEEDQGRSKATKATRPGQEDSGPLESPVASDEEDDDPMDKKVLNSRAKEGAPNFRRPQQSQFNVPETPAMKVQPEGSKQSSNQPRIPETPDIISKKVIKQKGKEPNINKN